VRAAIRTHASVPPSAIDRRHPAVQAAARAYRRGFGAAPALVRLGGTIPVVSLLQERFAVPVVMMGLALPDDQPHGPNERLDLPTFMKGIATSAWLLAELGELRPEGTFASSPPSGRKAKGASAAGAPGRARAPGTEVA
jgi:acetylornithine deacetylase/succinyl-diaminopimelate desuccinylase-like protein